MQPVSHYIEDLRSEGGLEGTDVARILNVSPATVSHWVEGRQFPLPRIQLVLSDLHYIVGRLKEYYSAPEIRVWLFAMHPQLDGKRAIDLISEGKSEDVIVALDRLDSEVYL